MNSAISRLAAAFAVLMSLSLGARAAEQSVDITPDFVANIAKGYGSAVLQKNSKGEPVVLGRINGRAYAILLIDCAAESCSLIQFIASLDAAGIALERVNDWNDANRFGKAHLFKDKIYLTQPVVSRNGLPRQTLERYFAFWQLVLGKAKPFFQDQ